MVLKEVARFHAIGLAVHEKDPQFFEEIKKCLQAFALSTDVYESDTYNRAIDNMCDEVCNDPIMGAYSDSIRNSVNKNRNWEFLRDFTIEEPWISVTHGDLWTNNILFKKGNFQDLRYSMHRYIQIYF